MANIIVIPVVIIHLMRRLISLVCTEYIYLMRFWSGNINLFLYNGFTPYWRTDIGMHNEGSSPSIGVSIAIFFSIFMFQVIFYNLLDEIFAQPKLVQVITPSFTPVLQQIIPSLLLGFCNGKFNPWSTPNACCKPYFLYGSPALREKRRKPAPNICPNTLHYGTFITKCQWRSLPCNISAVYW